MYQAGDLTVEEFPGDERFDGETLMQTDHPYHGKRVVLLPHSCEEWVIGGAPEVRALITDLEARLATLEKAGH